MKKILATMLILTVLITSIGIVRETTVEAVDVFQETFSGSEIDSTIWTRDTNAESWVIEEGKLKTSTSGANQTMSTKLAKGGNQVITFDISAANITGYTGFLFGGYFDPTSKAMINGYCLHITPNSMEMLKYGGNAVQLRSGATALTTSNLDSSVRIEINDPTIKVYVDDVLKITFTDTATTTYISNVNMSGIGIRNLGCTAYYDNIIVDDGAPEPTVTPAPTTVPSAPVGFFVETFSGSEIDSTVWTRDTNAESWVIEEGKLKTSTSGVNQTMSTKLAKGGNQVITFDISSANITGYTGFLFGGYFDPTAKDMVNGYCLHITPNNIEMLKYGGRGVVLRSGATALTTSNLDSTVKIEIEDPTIKVYVDDELKITFTDTAETTYISNVNMSGIGIRNLSCTAYYDNIVVDDGAPEPTVTPAPMATPAPTATPDGPFAVESTPLEGTEIFVDDFSSGTSKWSQLSSSVTAGGVYAIENNWLKLTDSTSTYKEVLLQAGDITNTNNYSIEYDFYLNNAITSYSGIYFDANVYNGNVSQGYLLQFVNGTLGLYRYAGSATKVGEYATSTAAKTAYNIKVSVNDGVISVKVNDVERITYTDATPFTTKQIVLRNNGQIVYYDNFRVLVEEGALATPAPTATPTPTAAPDGPFTVDSTPLEGTEIFADDFSSDASKWNQLSSSVTAGGTYAIENDWLKLTDSTSTYKEVLLQAGDITNTNNYSIEYDFYLNNAITSYSGIYFNANVYDGKVSQGYLLQFVNGTLGLYRYAGSATKVGEYATSTAAKTAYNIKVSVNDGVISVKVNDVERITYTDATPFTTKQVVLRNNGQIVYYDNFRVLEEYLQLVSSSFDSNTDSVVVDEPIKLTFNKPLTNAQLSSIALTNMELAEIVSGVTCTQSGSVVTINVSGNLIYATEYLISSTALEIWNDSQNTKEDLNIEFTTEQRPIIINSAIATKVDGGAISNLSEESSVKINLSVDNNKLVDKTVRVVVAGYVGTNRMTCVASDTLELTSAQRTVQKELTIPTTNFTSGSNAMLEVFIWENDLTNLKPLTPSKIIR